MDNNRESEEEKTVTQAVENSDQDINMQSIDNTQNPQEQISGAVVEDLVKLKNNEIVELRDRLQRAMADNDNTIKRYERQIQEAREYSIFNFARDILTVLDDFNLALVNMRQQITSETNEYSEKIQNIVIGVEMTQKKLVSILKQYNIKEVVPQIGDNFDYHMHHALSRVKDENYSKGTIVNVMQPGYQLKERLLRPAIVVVAE